MTLEQISLLRRAKEKVFFKIQEWDEKSLCWSEIHIIYNTEQEALKASKKLQKFRIVKRTDQGWRGV